ncbi:MAG: cellulose binding domain-containing protein [Pleurocapsa sp. MO_226.B13]|nr:cellulose binding domain-containing protein [Pleurocapsa sp. MO_226.B13]
MITNQYFSTKFTITDDWGGSYRVVLDLEALSTVKDWKIGVSLPNDYKIDQIYGAELTQEDNNKYISGVDWNKTLDRGNTTAIVLIIDEGGSNSAPILPQLLFDSFVDNATAKSSEKIIYVDSDFGGNLEKAIAAANDGDLVQLGSNTYYTRGYKKVSQSWSALFKWISFSQRLLPADRPNCEG